MSSIDNPYYFYNDNTPKTPESSSSSKGFSFFKRRNSKSNSSSCAPNKLNPSSQRARVINSATLGNNAILGSARGSMGSLGSFSGNKFQSYQMNNLPFWNGIGGTYQRSGFGNYRERLGSYNESITYSENDDVFFRGHKNVISRTPPDALDGPRRHSVGNFSTGDRLPSSSISDEVPNMLAPKPPNSTATMVSTTSAACNKYGRNQRSRNDNCRASNMDDILIVTARHSESGMLWANFLKNRFDKITKQRGRKPFNFFHIKIDEEPITSDITQKCSSTLLQIVILCPALIALPHSFLLSQMSVILNPEKVLGLLVEVSEDSVLEIHKSAFPSFRKWRRCLVRDHDQSLIGNVVGIATDILGKALCQLPVCHEANVGGHFKTNGTESFTVVPRKVKIGQNKVMILFNDPLDKDDWIKIKIEKADETIDISNYKKRNPYTLQFSIPETCMEVSTMIEIRIQKNERDLGSRPVKCESRLRELEQLLRSQDSPMEFMCQSLGVNSKDRDALDQNFLQNFQKNMPHNFHLLAGPFEKTKGFKDSNAEEYPTLLHFSAKWGLERLAIQLVECPGGNAACEIRNYAGKTPSEIAEYEGFAKLSKSLRSFSQMHEFSTMYHYFKGISDSASSSSNIVIEKKRDTLKAQKLKKQDFLPTQVGKCRQQAEYIEMNGSGSDQELLAQQEQVSCSLAVTNLNYINIDTTDDCNLQSIDEVDKKMDQVKLLSDISREVLSNELSINEPPYYQSNEVNNKLSDQFSQECLNVLENCIPPNSSSSQSDYVIQPSNVPVASYTLSTLPSDDYLTHPSNRPVTMIANYINDPAAHILAPQENRDLHLRMIFERKKSESRSRNGTLRRNASNTSTKGNPDDELAEIMYDFKNNVLSIREVEQLVEKWKNRNDVKQSFKDKQDQIERLREEYDRIQEHIKTSLKRPTPFERIKKLFSRNKSTTNESSGGKVDASEDTKSSIVSSNSGQRPISSLSMQSVSSSSSSGRMSTGSVCSGASLGDSGTHSDQDDRRQTFSVTCRLGNPGSLMPPAPRPIETPASTPTEESDHPLFPIGNRTPTATNLSEHYIIFPSNIPVFVASNDNHLHISDSMAFNTLNTIVEAKETTNEHLNNCPVKTTPIKVQKTETVYSQSIGNKTDVCSSFKQPTQLRRSSNVEKMLSTDIRKEMEDVYKNINSLEKKLENDVAKLDTTAAVGSLSRTNSTESNNTNKFEEILNETLHDQSREYMNI